MTKKKIIGTITPNGITGTVHRNGREFFVNAQGREGFNDMSRMADTVASYPPFGNDNAAEDDSVRFKRCKLRRFRLRCNFEMESGLPVDTCWMLVRQIQPGARIRLPVPDGPFDYIELYLDHYEGKILNSILRDLCDGIASGTEFIMPMPLPGDIEK